MTPHTNACTTELVKRKRADDYRGPETWGSRFQKRRMEIGLTQPQIADITGMTQQAVSRFENDDVRPRLETLEKYARAVGDTVERLFPMELRPKEPSKASKAAIAHKRTVRARRRNGGKK